MKAWLRQPIQASRATLLVVALALGMLGAGGIIGAAIALRNTAKEADRSVQRDALTRGDVMAIARRIFRLESPTAHELLKRVRHGLILCARDPRCTRRFRTVVSASRHPERLHAPHSTSAPAPTTRSPSTSPPRVPPSRRQPARRPASPGGGGSTSSSGAPPPRPPIDVATPDPITQTVHICTSLVAVNCPAP